MHTKFCRENFEGRNYLGVIGVCMRVILKWVLQNWMGGLEWYNMAQDKEHCRTCEHGSEPSVSIKLWEFLEFLV
jgi:hypothetical protein